MRLRPQARFGAQPPKAALGVEMSKTYSASLRLLLLVLFLQEQEKNIENNSKINDHLHKETL